MAPKRWTRGLPLPTKNLAELLAEAKERKRQRERGQLAMIDEGITDTTSSFIAASSSSGSASRAEVLAACPQSQPTHDMGQTAGPSSQYDQSQASPTSQVRHGDSTSLLMPIKSKAPSRDILPLKLTKKDDGMLKKKQITKGLILTS